MLFILVVFSIVHLLFVCPLSCDHCVSCSSLYDFCLPHAVISPNFSALLSITLGIIRPVLQDINISAGSLKLFFLKYKLMIFVICNLSEYNIYHCTSITSYYHDIQIKRVFYYRVKPFNLLYMLQEDVSWACYGSNVQVNHIRHAINRLRVFGSFYIYFIICLCSVKQFCKIPYFFFINQTFHITLGCLVFFESFLYYITEY